MPLIMRFLAGLGLWLVGEFVAFSLVAQAIGLDGAIVATLVTSLIGAVLLHRLGTSARQNLLSLLNARGDNARLDNARFDLGWFAPERLNAGFSAGLGSVLLILPGFLTDGIGLLLLARSTRAWRLFEGPSRRKADPVIELSPQDWRRIDESERR